MRRLAYSALAMLLSVVVYAGDAINIDKVIEKEFKISSDGTVNLKNKYGPIIVTEATSNEVKIKVTIDVKTNSESKAEKIFDRINIDFANSSDYVSAMTEIEDQSSWFSWSWGSSSTDFTIKYEVSMPISAHLKVVNKYGDINLPDLNNGLDIENKYGKIMMRSVEGNTNLTLGYGEMQFGDLGGLSVEMKYSKIRGSSAQEVKIESKYSKVNIGDVAKLRSSSKYDTYEIDKVGEVRNDGKYDKWFIGEVDDFRVNTKYAPIKIETLSGSLVVEQKYGNVYVEKVACNNKKIDIDVEYTDVELGMDGCGCEMNYSGEYVTLRLPREMEEAVEKDDEDTWLKGRFGNGKRDVRLHMRHAKLKIW